MQFLKYYEHHNQSCFSFIQRTPMKISQSYLAVLGFLILGMNWDTWFGLDALTLMFKNLYFQFMPIKIWIWIWIFLRIYFAVPMYDLQFLILTLTTLIWHLYYLGFKFTISINYWQLQYYEHIIPLSIDKLNNTSIFTVELNFQWSKQLLCYNIYCTSCS